MTYGLYNAQERGQLFIGPGTPVYAGMVVGVSSRGEDITVNVCKRSSSRICAPPAATRLCASYPEDNEPGQCLEFLADDELLEVTPKNLRIRKRILITGGACAQGKRIAPGAAAVSRIYAGAPVRCPRRDCLLLFRLYCAEVISSIQPSLVISE